MFYLINIYDFCVHTGRYSKVVAGFLYSTAGTDGVVPVRRPNNTKLLDVMAPIELPPNGRSIRMRTLYVNQLLLLTGTEGSPDHLQGIFLIKVSWSGSL